MRKFVLTILLIITGVLCIWIMFFGITIGSFKINSYSDIESANAIKKSLFAELNEKNNVEYEAKKSALNTAIKEYKEKKEEYNDLVKKGEIEDGVANGSINLYDVDFLMITIGNWATNKGVTLQLDITKSNTSTSVSSEYVMCNLNFTITGDYISITNFVYSIEDDDQLGFEIRDFAMEKGGENLQATFIVRDVPINSENLSTIPNSPEPTYDNTIDTDDSSN